jgi:hypothetical protein
MFGEVYCKIQDLGGHFSLFVRGCCGYGGIFFFCSVRWAVAATFVSCWVASCRIQKLSFIKHKEGSAFIGPCILLSGRSVSVIWVSVTGAVAGEEFGDMVWGDEVSLGDSFMIMGD